MPLPISRLVTYPYLDSVGEVRWPLDVVTSNVAAYAETSGLLDRVEEAKYHLAVAVVVAGLAVRYTLVEPLKEE